MLAPIVTAAVLLGGIWVCGWMGGSYDPAIPVLGHIVYFSVLSLRTGEYGSRMAPFWFMGVASALFFVNPWIGGSLTALALLVTAVSDLCDWWVTPRPQIGTVDPEFGETIEYDISPCELHRRKKLRKSQHTEART